VKFKETSFIENIAEKQGGAIMWTMNQPEIGESNIFSKNKANVYGDDIASYSQRIGQISER